MLVTPVSRGPHALGLLHPVPDSPEGVLPAWGSQLPSGPPQQVLHGLRVVITHRSTEFNFPEVEASPGRPLCYSSQCEVRDVLLLPEPKSRLLGRRLWHLLVGSITVRLLTDTAHPLNAVENSVGPSISCPGGPSLGLTTLVLDHPGDVHSCPGGASAASGSADTGGGETATSQSPGAASHSMEAPRLRPIELACSKPVREVLLNSRKPSTRVAYVAKWKRFTLWATQKRVSLGEAPIPCILDYLLALSQTGPSLSSLKVHLAAILVFHPGGDGRFSVFSDPVVKRFMKGMERVKPQVWGPLPTWDLNLVWSKLMAPPFEPLASCSVLFLTYKVVFLVAVTSARRVSELRALTVDPLYTVFHKDKVKLRPHLAFLPKVVSPFHVNQDITLLVFYPKPYASPGEQSLHTLDIRRALAFYMDRTTPFRKLQQLLQWQTG
ncbi:uncharacterized protein LOC142007924 [Carettochelys insculpta]|uniref:uncharacterized protein LOC142007924 n=1 Tax=Carettochelys insculpta TaxID=44489 RepID=UPI003EBAA0D1